MAMNWQEYLQVPGAHAAFRTCHADCGAAYGELRALIAELVGKTEPRTVACLGAGVMNDIPYDLLVARGCDINLVDWIPGSIDSGIVQSIIAHGVDGNPACAYCALDECAAAAFCHGYRKPGKNGQTVCDAFVPDSGAAKESAAACTAFARGDRPTVHYEDVTGGYASAFGREVGAAIDGVRNWKQAFQRACRTVNLARRHKTPLGIADGSIDLITSSMVMSQFESEPYTFFSRLAAERLGQPGEKEEKALRNTLERLCDDLVITQIERHAEEIARIMAPGGCCFAAFEMFHYDAGKQCWFLVAEMYKALEILDRRFGFDMDMIPAHRAVLRTGLGQSPSMVHCFVLRHKT